MRVIVTRPQAQGAAFAARLRALGLEAVTLPLIEIAPAPDAQGLRTAWADMSERALVMFVSANAVAHFFAARPASPAWPARTLAASSGPGTSAALRAAGVPAAQIVDPGPEGPFDTDTLWQRRLSTLDWVGQRVLLVRGEGGRDWLAAQLRQAGARLDVLAAYRRLLPALSDAARDALAAAQRDPGAHCWHFSSGEAIGNLAQLCPKADWSGARALATHPRIALRARERGFARVDEVGLHAQDVATALGAQDPTTALGALDVGTVPGARGRRAPG
jgi:uroporphyrinogen-III synthase